MWSNYKNNACNLKVEIITTKKHLYEHFLEFGHTDFIEDVYINLIGKTDPCNPTKHEDYWGETCLT